MVAVVVLGITAAPAGASGRASGRASVRTAGLDAVVQRLGAGDGSTVATPQQSPSPTDAIRGVKNHRDRRAWLESVATLIRDRSGDRVLVSGPAGGDSTEPEEPYVPVAGSFASATPAGDLDGDGGDDVVAYHFDLENYSTVLEARNGRSGATRWERASDDWSLLWPVRQDLTGDGRADLVELSLVILDEEYGDCDWEDDEDWCWPDEYSVTYRWDLSVVSGRDGATVWGRSYDGALTEVFTSDGEEPIPGLYQGSWTYEVTGTNIDVLPYLADLGADGAGEMVVNAIDLSYREHGDYQGAYPWLAGADYEEGGWQLRASTDVAVIDTATGTSGAETTEDSGGMIAILAPLADRGGSDSLVWSKAAVPDGGYRCAGVGVWFLGAGRCLVDGGAVNSEVVLLDGTTLQQRWSATFGGFGFAYPVGADLDGDGLDDLVVEMEDEDWNITSHFVGAGDGTRLWSSDSGWIIAAGPLDGAAGDDLVTVTYAYTDTSQPLDDSWSYDIDMTLERRNGRTGAVLASETHRGSGREDGTSYSEVWPYAVGGGDGDGDGAPDLTVGTLTYEEHWADEDYWWGITDATGVAQSGATGEVLYRAAEGALLYPVPDMDGDGLAEVIEDQTREGDLGRNVTFTPVRMVDGQVLWTAGDAASWVSFDVGGELDADRGADVLRHVDTVASTVDGYRLDTEVTALGGREGAERWYFRSRP